MLPKKLFMPWSHRLIAVDNDTDWLVAVTVKEHKCAIARDDLLSGIRIHLILCTGLTIEDPQHFSQR